MHLVNSGGWQSSSGCHGWAATAGIAARGAKSWVLWSGSSEIPGGRAAIDSEQAVYIREDGQIFPEPRTSMLKGKRKIEISFQSRVETLEMEKAGGW